MTEGSGDASAGSGGFADTWTAITSRRDVRQFGSRPIEDADLNAILEAGRRAPSSQNWQPWDFVVVTDRQQLTELANVWQGAGHVALSAATVALITRTDDLQKAQLDLGQAVMSIMLAAAALGIGSGHSAARDQQLARRLLGFPEDRTCAFLVSLGYPAGRPLTPLRRPNRRPFDDVVHAGRW
jgi:nitroreductase